MVRAFAGDWLVLMNREPTAYDEFATLTIREPIATALAEFCAAA
jgi:hypothetical protein